MRAHANTNVCKNARARGGVVLDDGSVSESGKSESNDIAQVVTPRGHVVETVPNQPAEQGSPASIGKDADIESSGEKQIFTRAEVETKVKQALQEFTSQIAEKASQE